MKGARYSGSEMQLADYSRISGQTLENYLVCEIFMKCNAGSVCSSIQSGGQK